MLSSRATYNRSAPAAPPMSLDSGRPSPRDALLTGGVTLAFLAAAAVGGWVASLFGPHSTFDTLGTIGAGRLIGWGFGVCILAAGLWLGLDFARLSRQSWRAYMERQADWHQASLDAYTSQDGQVTEELSTEWNLSASDPKDVLIAALALYLLAKEGQDRPWSVRTLRQEGVWIGGVRMGDLNTTQAEQLPQVLEGLGMIGGRRARTAGAWVPQSADEVIGLFMERWGKQ